MITVQEATDIIDHNLFTPAKETVNITNAIGRILAEKITADRDLPPFDRVTMDGVAILYNEWRNGKRKFFIEDTSPAGRPALVRKNEGSAIEVMTGTLLPEDTDTVIRYEDLEITGDHATITLTEIQQGQNIHKQGSDAKKDEVLLEPGIRLSPAEVALMASVGKGDVLVYAFPKAAIVATGDELIEIEGDPEPYQIRRSNTYAIQAAMEEMGWDGTQFHLPDNKEALVEALKMIAAGNDVIILSGGISKGKYDFVPRVLEEIGVVRKFQHVSQRPGKPFWFGVSPKGRIVFALPGNPVSTYMCFYRYIKPWLLKSFGVAEKPVRVILAKDVKFEPDLTYFVQVSVRNEEGKLMANPVEGGGSGDFANLKNVDGFLELPKDKKRFEAGEVYTFIPFR